MSCRLRRLREGDLEQVMRWRMLPEVTRYMYTDPVLDLAAQKAWFERLSRSDRDVVWIIELVPGGEPVGVLSLSQIDRVHSRCHWAYYIGSEAARGRGLASPLERGILHYVFEVLGLNKLCCEVLADNDRVVALHERFGSRVEGTLRQHVRKGGRFHDVVCMGILRADWLAGPHAHKPAPIEIE